MKNILPVYPWPMHEKVRAVLAEVSDIEPVEALPGGPGPVLAVVKTPHFVCDAIVVKEPEALLPAVDVVLGRGLSMVTVRDMISEAFGTPVTETLVKRKGPTFS